MVFSYNWLQSFFKKKLPTPQKLAGPLIMKSFEVEKVKKMKNDWILDIDVTPNRAGDCFSHIGIAREIAAIINSKFQIPEYKIQDTKYKIQDFISLEVRDKNACPRYTARVIIDVKVGVSPKWIQERLISCGLRPINNIVDIVNYVMLETGQPLHAFDCEKLENKKIVVRFAKKGEKIITLDEQNFSLDEDILVIADDKKPVAIAGIKGGKLPEVDKKTKTIVLESANFESKLIRRTSKKLKLKTDASLRYEHGIDPNLTEIAINRAAFLIQKIALGKVAKGLIDFYPKKVFPKKIKLDLDYMEKLLGEKVPKKEIKNILEKLDFKIQNLPFKILTIEIPTKRLDISIQEDLIEEIGRIYGYEKIKPIFPITSLIPSKRNLNIFWEDKTKNILKEVGFYEVYNYSFVSEKDSKIFDLTSLIKIRNPMSGEQRYLRPNLIPNLLKNVQRNQNYFSKIKIFELGKIFKSPKNEKRQLTGLITGEAFYEVKGAVDSLLNGLGISDIWYDSFEPSPKESKIFIWHPKKCAEIKVGKEKIGFLGEISSKVLESYQIKNKVIVFDIDFEKLEKLSLEETIYQPISRFPAAVRDLAILVPQGTKVVEVLNKINIAGGSLVKDIDIFDIYEGKELPQGKKNLAFHIIYQAERTLISKEIDEIQQKIIKILEEDPEWQVRK